MGFNGEIDAISFNKNLQETYRRYLFTANPISDNEPELKELFLQKLGAEFSIIRGPYLHTTPTYKQLFSVKQLVDGEGEVTLSRKLLQLPRSEFDPERPLYTHQVAAMQTLLGGRNLLLATGTGSGKTESFLLPILNSVLVDPSPGLRAIIIYPMNALADDQLLRLRKLLAPLPEVTFGRYTGDTPWDLDGEREGLPNERLTREELRSSPPHILLTNFAMLEYLLLRPRDSQLFEGHKLSFLVLDEAHSYSGAQGIEIALLLRRVKQYLEGDNSKIQFVLTSATMGDEEGATDKVKAFAKDLTGSNFKDCDIIPGEVVDSFSADKADTPSLSSLIEKANSVDFSRWQEGLEDGEKLVELLDSIGIATGGVQERAVSRILFDVLHECSSLSKIHDHCRQRPSTLEEICGLWGLPLDQPSLSAVRWLVTMGAYARKHPDSAALLPSRLHFFCRGLSGATVCVNEDCDGKLPHPSTQWSQLYLEDRSVCECCESKVLPLVTCVHCGLPVIKIYKVDGKWKKAPDVTLQPQTLLLTWSSGFEVEEGDDGVQDEKYVKLCLSCHGISEINGDLTCCDNQHVRILRVIDAKDAAGNLPMCPNCHGTSGSFDTVLREFRTSEDAPTAVLAETIIRELPQDPSRKDCPGGGRNLLVFSDSRQRAAFFAPYLGQTTAETVYMGPLEAAIENAERKEDRPVTFEEVAREFERALPAQQTVAIRKKEGDYDYFELVQRRMVMTVHKSEARKEAERTLYRHFCSSQKQKTTLQGMGIASLCLDLNEYQRDAFPRLVPELFGGGEEKGWQAVQALVEILVQRIAVEFPDHVTANPDIVKFGPMHYTFHLKATGRQDGSQRQLYRWNSYLTTAAGKSRERVIKTSRQGIILCKLLGLDPLKDSGVVSDLLNKVWEALKSGIIDQTPWPGEFRVNRNCMMITTKSPLYTCERCGHVTSLGALGFCLVPSCSGKTRLVSPEAAESKFNMNHYRRRFLLPSLPLEVREHTAQLTNKVGKEYQELFMEGKVNVLSSSTTFEMGIDVGNLKAVLLRNVPPSTSSYIQRAGRAGRRKDGISLAITFSRNVPHDQFNYRSPENIILGKVPVPYVNVANVPLAQRHCNSALLGAFFRDIKGIDPDVLERPNVGTFFLTKISGSRLVDRFTEWATDPAINSRLLQMIAAIIPKESKLGPGEAVTRSVETLGGGSESVLEFHVNGTFQTFQRQIDELVDLERKEADNRQRIKLLNNIESLKRLASNFRDQSLLDFLSSCSWLPGYAFPQDIVKLLVRQPNFSERMRLERDREIGISEYAPGAEIIADGKLFKSAGVSFLAREPEIRWYSSCRECRKIETGLIQEQPPAHCSNCGAPYIGASMARPYIKPQGFTTKVNEPVVMPRLNRLRPLRATDVFLLEGAEAFADSKIPGVSFGIKENGKLFRANSGKGFLGFHICGSCGLYFETLPKKNDKVHESPWGGKCGGMLRRIDLAHEIVTDILQIRFEKVNPPPPLLIDKAFWMSLVSAFLNGACEGLGIANSDIDGTYHGWTQESFVGELVIYDKVPGGAGHIQKIVEKLDIVLDKTLERVRDCTCPDVESSCYACLRSYSNQFYWDILQRRPVTEWLSQVLGK